jgi:hypothetical protein
MTCGKPPPTFDPNGCPPGQWYDPTKINNGNSGWIDYPITARCAKIEVDKARKAAGSPVCKFVNTRINAWHEADGPAFGETSVINYPYATFKFVDVRPNWVRMEVYFQQKSDCN